MSILRNFVTVLTFAAFVMGGAAAPWTVSMDDGLSVIEKTADAKEKENKSKKG